MKMRAPFRYWGAKVRMAPWIIERLPEHDHFVEVFAGSAAAVSYTHLDVYKRQMKECCAEFNS